MNVNYLNFNVHLKAQSLISQHYNQPLEVFCKKRCSLKFRKIHLWTTASVHFVSINFVSAFLFICQIIEKRWNATKNLRGKGRINEMKILIFWHMKFQDTFGTIQKSKKIRQEQKTMISVLRDWSASAKSFFWREG